MFKPYNFLPLFLLPLIADAASSGKVGLCDAHGPFGCSSWKLDNNNIPDRLQCNDPNAGVMDWVKKPERSDKFTVVLEDPAQTSYTSGGSFLPILVKVHDKDFKFRGILLHAVDSGGTSVGEMVFPSSQSDTMFHSPADYCPHAALHADAELKPYVTLFRFKTPAQGTGTITFRTLIKVGPANMGEFYYPSLDLTLAEKKPTVTDFDVQWYRSEVGESCGHACMKLEKACHEETLSSVHTASATKSEVGEKFLGDCLLPFLFDTSEVSPTSSVEGDCYYGGSGSEASCFAKGDSGVNGLRFCPCVSVGKRPSGDRRLRLSYEEEAWEPPASKSSKLTPSLSFVTLLLLSLSYLLQAVESHNWMHSRARANFEASTTKPCRGRKATDTHVQIANEQTFAFKWATGHSSPSLVAIVKDEFESYLHRSDFEKMVKVYVEEAPANKGGMSAHKKFHGIRGQCPGNDCSFYDEQVSSEDGIYKREVPSNEQDFISRDMEDAPAFKMWEYEDDVTNLDTFANYHSEKFPWIESAGFFDHNIHLPRDFDVVKLGITGRHGEGHYIAYWHWRGYSDCADVDYFETETDVEKKYGVASDEFVFSRLDHCQYIEPKDIVTNCKFVDNTEQGVKKCVDDLEANVRSNIKNSARLGINIIPVKNSPKVSFDWLNIPLDHEMCANSPNTLYEEIKSEKPVDWNLWAKTDSPSRVCSAEFTFEEELTYKEAVLKCTDLHCLGLSVESSEIPDIANFNANTKHNFKGCSSTATTASIEWHTFFKTTLHTTPPTYNVNENKNIVVNFQETKRAVVAENQNALDSGLLYGTKTGTDGNSYVYGWSCDTQSFIGADPSYTSIRNFFHQACANGEQRIWEMELENGLYKVELQFRRNNEGSVETSGCAVEHVDFFGGEPVRFNVSPLDISHFVSVTDGRLTLEGGAGCEIDEPGLQKGCLRCRNIDKIHINKVTNADDFLPIWLPSSANPYVQYEVNGPVSLVTIMLPEAEDLKLVSSTNEKDHCRSWLFFKGAKQCNDNRESGKFNYGGNNDEGAIVSLSDDVCVGERCGGTVLKICKVVTDVSNCLYNTNFQYQRIDELCPINVNCGGTVAKYLRVELPGSDRVIDFKVNVNKPQLEFNDIVDREKLISQGRNDMLACYGLEAREQKDTTPEYIISGDVNDPIFYSTCLVRERKYTFLPPVGAPKDPTVGYKFNNQCVSCGSYLDNKNTSAWYGPRWEVADECENCFILEANMNFSERIEWPVSYDTVNFIEYYEPGILFDALKTDKLVGGCLVGFLFACGLYLWVVRRTNNKKTVKNFLGLGGGGGGGGGRGGGGMTKSPMYEMKTAKARAVPPPLPQKKNGPPPLPAHLRRR